MAFLRRNHLLAESLQPKDEAKLKDIAKIFAKTIGAQAKAGGIARFDGVEATELFPTIKKFVKMAVGADNCKSEIAKKLGIPSDLASRFAKEYSAWLLKTAFKNDKRYVSSILKKSEQLKFFASTVLDIWRRDDEISKLMYSSKSSGDDEETDDEKDEEDVDFSECDAFRATGTEDAALAEDDDDELEDPEIDEEQEEDLQTAEEESDEDDELFEDDELSDDALDEDDPEEGIDQAEVENEDEGFDIDVAQSSNDTVQSNVSGSWYCVADVDPACKQMERSWRFGPLDIADVSDFIYPERKYKKGATVLRNKRFQTPNDGVVQLYVGLASIFDAVKNNDSEALKKLDAIGINRNISLGLDPDDDYSTQYALK